MTIATDQLTVLLKQWQQGDQHAHHSIVQLAYQELKTIARRQLARESSRNELQPTQLVHEAYLKLQSAQQIDWQNRQHYLAVCARAMRQVLVDIARKSQSNRHKARQVTLTVSIDSGQPDIIDTLTIDSALDQLEKFNRQQAIIAELRFFGGLTIPETATALNLSTATVNRNWRAARAYLRSELTPAT